MMQMAKMLTVSKVVILQLLTIYLSQTNSLSSLSNTIGSKTPIVICPGFGNDSIDYDCPLEQPPSKGLKTILSTRGFDIDNIYTVPIKRTDWIRVGGGLFDIPNFYINQARPDGLGYGWYIRRLKECVDLAYEESGGEKVILIAHSAGGWLARAAMGNGVWSEENSTRTQDRVSCLVTIGAIHKAPEDETTCVTRGALKFVEENYPGVFLKDDGIKYVTVGGNAIMGNKIVDEPASDSDADKVYAVRGEGSASKVAYTAYEAVCGDGNAVGDGVVPLAWSMLDGAKQIELDGVLHSINEAGTTLPTDRWYGSEKVIDRWLPTVLDELSLNNKAMDDGDIFSGIQKWASGLLN